MPAFSLTVEPGGPRVRAMILAACEAEGVVVARAPETEFESRDATAVAALALGSLNFLVQASDSPTVHRVIERVRARLPELRASIEPRNVPPDDEA